ncbi:hypothetical protein NFJ02_25g57170 [Pycnococcus provasolii]
MTRHVTRHASSNVLRLARAERAEPARAPTERLAAVELGGEEDTRDEDGDEKPPEGMLTPAGLHHADFYCSTLEYHINKLTKTPVEVSREAFQAFRVEYEAEAHEAALSTGKHEADDAPAEGAEGVAKKARTMMSNLFSFGGGASGGGADEGDDKHLGRLIRAMNRFSMVGKERAERRSSEEQSTMASMAEQATGGGRHRAGRRGSIVGNLVHRISREWSSNNEDTAVAAAAAAEEEEE